MLQPFHESGTQNIILALSGRSYGLVCNAVAKGADLDPNSCRPANGCIRQGYQQLGLLLVWVLFLFLSPGLSETPGRACRLLIPAQKIYPGSVFLAQARCSGAIAKATGTFCERRLIFFSGKKKTVSYAFVGVDLESKPEVYRFAARVELQGSEIVDLQENVRVLPKRFPVQKITVAEKYAQPSPEDQKRSAEETKRLESIWKTVSISRYWEGKFKVPLSSELTSGFGRRRVVNGQPRSPHSGVDLKADTGTPIHAANTGKVVLAEDLFFSGNTVVIDHGLGLYTYYGHCSKILVQADEIVKSGQAIAEVGATGRVTGPHLHWACRLNEARVNPLDLLSLEIVE
jgi:murein DD-endopeptidase MepM/ murein hydrolase activator NlpD